MKPLGHTRSTVRSNYALLTSDTFMPGAIAGWTDAVCHTHISPAMGARFIMRRVTLNPGGKGTFHASLVQHFFYVIEGEVSVHAGHGTTSLGPGGYAFVASGQGSEVRSASGAVLIVFEKVYEPIEGHSTLETVVGNAGEKGATPFMGDPDLTLKLLLPDTPSWDMAVNILTFQPGARLPMVEVHVMEHGLLMLQGEGIYRLGDDWYPVEQGDVIWMGPFCPQWFGALGKQPAAYLYYKDINRHALH